MKKTSVIVALLITLIAGFSEANTTSDIRKTLQAAYKTSDAAVVRRDSKTLLGLLTPDYQVTDLKGKKSTKTEMSRRMHMWFTTYQTIKTTTTIKKVVVTRGKAKVTIGEVGLASGIDPKTKKLSKLVSDAVAEDTWVKIKGKWLKQKTKTLRMRWVLDGKEVKF